MDGSDAVANYHTVRHELAAHKASLGHRPEIVAVTKAELPGAAEVQQRVSDVVSGTVLLISAVTGQGLNQLIHTIARHLEQTPMETDRLTT
jgi:GTP-binding protein